MIFKDSSNPNHSMILSHSVPPVKRSQVHEKLGGDMERNADPNPPKGYPRPDDTIQQEELGEEGTSGGVTSSYFPCCPKKLQHMTEPFFPQNSRTSVP